MKSLLWSDRRSWEQRRSDALWALYRRLTKWSIRLTHHGAMQEVTTQDLPADERAAVHLAQYLADTWFDGLNLEYHGIALGPLLRHKVGGYNAHLHGLCRHAFKAQALLEAYEPDRVVMAETALLPAGAFLENLARQKGVQVSALVPRVLRPLGRAIVNWLFYAIGYGKTEVPLTGAPMSPMAQVGDSPVLFVASMNNYLNPLLPVAQALKARGIAVATLVPHAATGWGNYRALQQMSNIVWAEELMDQDLKAEIAASRRAYSRLWPEKRSKLRERLRLDNGLDLWPFAAPGMRVVFEHLLPDAVGYVGLAERAYRQFDPRALVIARQRRAFENAFVAVARRDNIPSAMILHGHISDHPIYHFVDGRFDQMDRIFAWGEAQKASLVAKGAPAERVLVTGNPQWDRLAAGLGRLPTPDACRAAMAAALGLPRNAFWATFTSQPVSRAFLGDIREALRAIPNSVLIVKIHPGERTTEYRIPAADQQRCRVVQDVDLHTLLRASDVVLTYTSTTNLEALAVGTPLIVVDFAGNLDTPHQVDLAAYGVPEVHHPSELAQALARLQQEPSWGEEILRGGRQALEDYAHSLDGRATERVVDALLQLARKGPPT